MEKKLFTPRFVFILTLIICAALMRLIPHWPNFTPIAALALFGGSYINRRSLAFLLPISAMLISDLIIGFHNHMLAVYLSFALVVLLGSGLRGRVKVLNTGMAALASSTIFFLITNFAEWLGSSFYPQTFSGLISCYTAGLPFFQSGVLGDLFYTGVLFGGFYLAVQKIPTLRVVEKG